MRARWSRLTLVLGAVVFLDTVFYAVITPLLPQLSHQLHLSKLSAGVMTGGYPAGMLLASLPGGALAVKRGARFTVVVGITLLIVSTVAFGLLRNAVGLDLARFVEGVGGACSWAGSLSWLVAGTAPDRRGAVMGSALGTSIGGALFGPVIGALASAIGRGVLFCGLAAAALVLIIAVLTLPDQRQGQAQPVRAVLRVVHRPEVAGALWLMVLPAVVSGAFSVLVPLQMSHLGAGAGLIAVTFFVGAAIEGLISPIAGLMSDRHGRTTLLRGALVLLAATIAAFTLPGQAGLLAGLVIVTLATLGVFWAPVLALMADVAERHGVEQAHAAAIMNLAWAAGQIAGSVGGGGLAKAYGDLVPTLGVTTICLATLVWLHNNRLAPKVQRQAPLVQ